MDLNMEIGKKKEIYPSKKSINLCYQEEASTVVSSLMLKLVFAVLVLVFAVKIFVVDVISERNEAKEQLENIQKTLDAQMLLIQDYDKVVEEYSRYSYKVLIDALSTQDRLEILEMLENTVYKNGGMNSISIAGNVITLDFSGLNLDECAQLIADVQKYDMVQTVVISNQTGSADGTYEGNLSITLKDKNTGGEQ